jgi:hypothetical protein
LLRIMWTFPYLALFEVWQKKNWSKIKFSAHG